MTKQDCSKETFRKLLKFLTSVLSQGTNFLMVICLLAFVRQNRLLITCISSTDEICIPTSASLVLTSNFNNKNAFSVGISSRKRLFKKSLERLQSVD